MRMRVEGLAIQLEASTRMLEELHEGEGPTDVAWLIKENRLELELAESGQWLDVVRSRKALETAAGRYMTCYGDEARRSHYHSMLTHCLKLMEVKALHTPPADWTGGFR